LLLIGKDLDDPDAPSGQRVYAERFAARAAQLDVAGAVEKVAFTADVAGALEAAGVVLSSSVRESFHLGLVEGAASGAVPVVRDWPLFAAVGGPHGLFPDEWIVSTAEAAAARVLRTTVDEQTWRAEGDAARQWVMERYDGSVTWPEYDRLLLSGGAAELA
jgi:glycosyltransferase involved in cell wall biosynthesis